jgi:hypothetical protein
MQRMQKAEVEGQRQETIGTLEVYRLTFHSAID